MQLFYSTNITEDKILLNKHESHHCIRVLRKKKVMKFMSLMGMDLYIPVKL